MEQKLSLEETLELIQRWQINRDQEAINTLTKRNIGMVKNLANKYYHYGLQLGLTFEELESAGLEGLVTAIHKFDYENHDIRAFSTYLYRTIANQIKDELKANTKNRHVLSLSQFEYENDDGNMAIEELIGTEKEELEEMAMVSSYRNFDILKALECLTPLERKVIVLRYLDTLEGRTCQETANILGCRRQNVSSREQSAIKRLRHMKRKALQDYLY